MEDVQTVARAIKQLQWRHHRAIDARLRLLGATIVQWDALRAMVREPGATARRLASETFQSEQSFGAVANRMERNGLITRSAGTGRALEHRLTPEGERLLARGSAIAEEEFAATVGALEAGERRLLLDLLRRALGEDGASPTTGDPEAGDPRPT